MRVFGRPGIPQDDSKSNRHQNHEEPASRPNQPAAGHIKAPPVTVGGSDVDRTLEGSVLTELRKIQSEMTKQSEETHSPLIEKIG